MIRKAAPAHVVCAMVALTGCATYSPDPIDPSEVLQRLDAVQWTSSESSSIPSAAAVSVGPRELAAFAVSTHPQLVAVRAEVGIRRALLVEAGLLPDPQVGWGAMDVVSAEVIDGTFTSTEVVSGFSLMFPLPRPGEVAARVESAKWREEEARRRVAAAEWSLTRDIHVAYEEVLAAGVLLAQTQALTELAESTYDYFKRARDAGAATAIEANLALGESQAIRLDGVRVQARYSQAKQALNALMGLAPTAEISLRAGEDPGTNAALRGGTDELTAHAVESRPDLTSLLAGYQAAEEEVRLAISKQYPQVSVGTGINVTVPVFSKFGRPEIQTAIASRERLRCEYTAAVHNARQEIAVAQTLWELAQREVELVEGELLPNAEQNIELSREAVRAGEATLLETLALQSALIEARTRSVEVRAERSKRAWSLLAASGWLLGAAPTNNTTNNEGSK